MKWLMVFFLLIPFFLPFPVEGNPFLEIQNEYYNGSEEEITFSVFVNNGSDPVEVEFFGFDVIYDQDILEYQEYSGGYLLSPGSSLSVRNVDANTLRIDGHGVIKEGDIGELMQLTFILKKYENTTLRLTNLDEDIWFWNACDGQLKARGESNGSGSVGPRSFPLLNWNIPRFIPPPSLGYWGFTFPQWNQPIFSPIPMNYDYYSFFQVLPYQSLPYPYW